MMPKIPDLAMTHKLEGIFPGVVEATTDPKLLGRCRVRVQTVDGDESSSPVKTLPWAMPCFPGFMFSPPQVGDAVWVMFQGGDRMYPVYLGWFPTTPLSAQQRQRHPDLAGLTYDGELTTPRTPSDNDTPQAGDEPFGNNVETYQTPANLCETPPEVLKGSSPDPNIRIFKTWRGHTIVFNDNPEGEYLKIIDRSGQMIMFDCAVQMSSDQNNATPRGGSIANCFQEGIGEADATVNDGRSQLPISVMKDNSASIRITDLFGQYIESWAEENNAHMRIQSARSKDDDQTPNHYIEISSSQNDENISIVSREGNSIVIDETNSLITITHKSGSKMTFDQNVITITHKSGHTLTFNQNNILVASDQTTKTLLWLENAMQKFNNHTHMYNPGSGGPTPSSAPSTSFNTGDGTTVTKAG